MPYFGSPQTIRLDPAGAFRGVALEEFCDRHQIYLDVIPGEAHWKLSAVEQAIQGVKSLMGKLVAEDPELDAREALGTAVRTFNQREVIRGFSPAQHALGQSPDASGRLDFSGKAPPPELLVENPSGEFSRNVERQRVAEQALADWQAQQRLARANSSRGRRVLSLFSRRTCVLLEVASERPIAEVPRGQEGPVFRPSKDPGNRDQTGRRWGIAAKLICVASPRPQLDKVCGGADSPRLHS